MSLSVGDKIPDLTLPANGGREVGFKDYKGKKLVVYFYPKDNTPGCTQEGQDYRDLYKQFQKAGADIVGISKDSVKSHDNFVAKYEFPFTLLADENHSVAESYGVWGEKSMYGKKYMGVERTTFIIDGEGKIRKIFRKVKPAGHAEEVKSALAGL